VEIKRALKYSRRYYRHYPYRKKRAWNQDERYRTHAIHRVSLLSLCNEVSL